MKTFGFKFSTSSDHQFLEKKNHVFIIYLFNIKINIIYIFLV